MLPVYKREVIVFVNNFQGYCLDLAIAVAETTP